MDVEAILVASACQPYLVQILCSVAVELLNERRWHPGDPLFSPEDLAGLIPSAIDRAQNYFLDHWRDHVPTEARPLLRSLACGGPAPDVDPTDEALVEAVLALERRHIVARTPSGLEFVTPMFGAYIRAKQSLG